MARKRSDAARTRQLQASAKNYQRALKTFKTRDGMTHKEAVKVYRGLKESLERSPKAKDIKTYHGEALRLLQSERRIEKRKERDFERRTEQRADMFEWVSQELEFDEKDPSPVWEG